MNNSAPKELGIVAVAALFGFIALLVAYLVLAFGLFASIMIGALVGIVTAIVLWLGWREPAQGPTGPRDLSADATTTPTAAPNRASAAATATATAASPVDAVATAAPIAETAAPAETVKPAPKAKPAAKAAKPVKKPAAKPTAKIATAKPAPDAATTKPVAADGKPETLTTARAGGADDLKQLKGVGPALEKTLNELGFYHFDQVASWGEKEVEWVDSRLKFKGRIERDEWVKQANILANGGTTEFSEKTKKGAGK